MRRILLALLLVASPMAFADAPDAGTTPPSAEDSARRSRVYARVGARTITVGDVEDAIAQQTPFQRRLFATEPARVRELARDLVEQELLAQEARKRGLQRAPVVREIVDGNLVQALVHDVIDERITPQSIPDADIATYHVAHPDEFARPEMVRASHVLFDAEADARAALAQCRTMDLAAFRQLARDRSLDDETKQSGGDLRYFTRDGRPMGQEGRPIERALVEASFGIGEVGECAADVVTVGERFSVVKLTGRRPSQTTPLEAASDGIRRKLWRERRDAELERVVTELRGRFRVTRRDELVRLVNIAPPAPSELVHSHGESPTAGDSH